MGNNKEIGYVFYRLPNQPVRQIGGEVTYQFPKSANEAGFLFSPFKTSPTEKNIFIKDQKKTIQNISLPDSNDKEKSTSKTFFLHHVKNIIETLNTKKQGKIVAARVLKLSITNGFDPLKFFYLIAEKHKNTFVSLVYIPGKLFWIGNSPEILLQEKNNQFLTYSLAGTKKKNDKNWSEKEFDEQLIVTNFITKKIQAVTKQQPTVTAQKTLQMGDLEHLKNEISIEKTNGISWQLLAKKLHPTPAVCGVPFRFAQQYILDNENFDRKYYSGYLGPVNMAGETNLYVNLRCMQATKKSLLLYAGCGITALSNPENEWEETNAKLSLLQQLLEP